MEADKALLPEGRKSLLDFPLNRLGHGGNIRPLVQKVSNHPIQIGTIGAKDLHLRELFYQGFKPTKFHSATNVAY